MTGCTSVRLADPCDWPAAEAMLRAGFGDEDWFLRAFFDFVWLRCDTLLSLSDGVPAAMTALLPCRIHQPGMDSLPALYLYALTTLPAFRGQGHARRLLHAAQERCTHVFLHAEDAALHSFYQQLGWQDAMLACRKSLPAESGIAPPPVDGAAYLAAREALLQNIPHIVWNEGLCAFADRMLACEGGGLYADARAACAVTGIQDGRLLLSEALGDVCAAQALAAQLGCASLSALLPCAQGDIVLAQSIGAPMPAPLHLGFDFD